MQAVEYRPAPTTLPLPHMPPGTSTHCSQDGHIIQEKEHVSANP